jgi:hypothetical protein
MAAIIKSGFDLPFEIVRCSCHAMRCTPEHLERCAVCIPWDPTLSLQPG